MEKQTQPDRPAEARAAGPAIGTGAGPAVGTGDHHAGAELRAARERMGLSLETAAAELNIRAEYLRGLERNDHSALPALAYTMGFVRSYAAFVGLDPGKLARRFGREAGRFPVEQDYTWLKPIERGRFSGSLLLLLSLAIASAAYVGWYYRTADDRKPAAAADILRTPRPAPGAIAAADAAGALPGETAGPARGGAAGPHPSSSAPRRPEDEPAQAQGGETAALPEAPDTGAAGRPAAGGDRVAEPGSDPESESGPDPEAADRQIVLRARGLVWIRVRDPQTGRVIVEGIMKQGNEVTVPDSPGLVLDVGRASQLEYLVGGRSAGVAGPTAAVRHNLSLDPARLARLARSGGPAAARDGPAPGPAPGPDGDRAEPRNAEGGTPEGGTRESESVESGTAEGGESEERRAVADGTLVLRARGLVWVRVRHPQTRQVLVEGIMKKGNVVNVPDDPGLVLDVGRANQLEYLVGGKPAGLAGDSPGPVHNLSLDPERLKPGG